VRFVPLRRTVTLVARTIGHPSKTRRQPDLPVNSPLSFMAGRSEDSDREGRKPEYPLGPGGGTEVPMSAGLASSVGCDLPDCPCWAWRSNVPGGWDVNHRPSEPESEAWRGPFHAVRRSGHCGLLAADESESRKNTCQIRK